MSNYTVTKSPPVLLAPSAPTPSETLPLSSIDRMAMRGHVHFVSVYSHGERPTVRIKDAFAKALVHYYPVAGQLSDEGLGEPVVYCTGDGIWFVEAVANCSLADVNYLERPLMIPKEKILPRLPAGVKVEDQIFMAQITEFTCGGFAVGISFNHLIFDGQGAAQFLKAVGEMSQGLPEPTVKPIWSRESIPDPPKVPFSGSPSSFTQLNLVSLFVEISPNSINEAKEKFMFETGEECSSFEVITASIFKSRVNAIKLALDAEVCLAVAAGTRHLLHGVLPSVEGYYGNCVYTFRITKTSEEINNASVLEVITFIKNAKDSHSKEFVNWMNEGHHTNIPMDYGTVVVSDWRWLGFNEVNYGWGVPKYVFGANEDFNNFGFANYLSAPMPNQGIRVMLRCVEQKHTTKFLAELQRLLMIKLLSI